MGKRVEKAVGLAREIIVRNSVATDQARTRTSGSAKKGQAAVTRLPCAVGRGDGLQIGRKGGDVAVDQLGGAVKNRMSLVRTRRH